MLAPNAARLMGQHFTFMFENCSFLMGEGHRTAKGDRTGIDGTQKDSVLDLEGRKASQTVKQSTSDGKFTR